MLGRPKLKIALIVISAVIAGVAILMLVQSLFSDSPKSNDENLKSRLIESDDGVVERVGNWTMQATDSASGGSYLSSSGSPDDALILTFVGSQVEVIYAPEENRAAIILDIDGSVVQTSNDQQRTVLDDLEDGLHTLRVYSQDGGVVGLDAFRIARPPNADLVAQPINRTKFGDDVLDDATTHGGASIIVLLEEPAVPYSDETAYKASIKQTQNSVLDRLIVGHFEVSNLYKTLPSFAGYADFNAIIELQNLPEVKFIELNSSGGGSADIADGSNPVQINKSKLYPPQLLKVARNQGTVCIDVVLVEPQPIDTLPLGQLPDPELIKQVQDKVLDGIRNGRFDLSLRLTTVAGFGGYADYDALLELQAMPEVVRIDMCMQGFEL